MSTEKKALKRPWPPQALSEVFKRLVVKEFEQGLSTKAEPRRRYNIRGHACIDRWLKK